MQPESAIAIVLGTRPEIIKLGHLIRLLGSKAVTITTGQHYDDNLTKYFFDAFELEQPSHAIDIGGKSRGAQIGKAVSALDDLFSDMSPRAVVVQGDTNSTLAAALAANAREIPLVHVEAGLRSNDRLMPEEHNRVLTDHLSDLCLAPTEVSRENLLREGIESSRIRVTGNTVVEAVTSLLPEAGRRAEILESHGLVPAGFVLSTFHRPENVDDPSTLRTILHDLAIVDIPVLLPMHPRARARVTSNGFDQLLERIQVVDPLGYPEFLALMSECAMVIGDSGGMQEEVSVLKRPMIVIRRSTERPEVLGTFARLMPASPGFGEQANNLLADLDRHLEELAQMPSPYGDGSASARSMDAIFELVEQPAI